jgi:transcriptional regulator with XRE-family HTH domain
MAPRTPSKPPVRSVYRVEHQAVVGVLRAFRDGAGLTQVELAERLGRTQSYVSSAERGSKLDALQLRDWCVACEKDLVAWAKAVEAALAGPSKRR